MTMNVHKYTSDFLLFLIIYAMPRDLNKLVLYAGYFFFPEFDTLN